MEYIKNQAGNKFKFNKGTFLKYPINEFIKNKLNNINLNNINNNQLIIKNENNFEYNLDYKTDKPNIVDHFSFRPNIGLKSIGNNCFMNAFLQCLCNIKNFVNFFKYDEQIINIVKKNKNNLSSSFKLIIEKLWPNNFNSLSKVKNYYDPKEFNEKILKMIPSFDEVTRNKLKYLIIQIITLLHEELNKSNNIINNYNNLIIDQRN